MGEEGDFFYGQFSPWKEAMSEVPWDMYWDPCFSKYI